MYKRQESSGIITGYRVTVAQEKLGYHITAFVNVVLPPERQEEDVYKRQSLCGSTAPFCPDIKKIALFLCENAQRNSL